MRRFLSYASAIILAALPATASAFTVPEVVCSGLFGCGQNPENTIYNNILPAAASLFIQLAGAGAVIFVIIAGVRLVTQSYDEGKVGAARKSILYALGGLGLALTSANIVSFVTTENYGQADPDFLFGGAGLLASVVRLILTVFNVSIIVMLLYAGARMVMGQGSADEFKAGGQMIKWCLIGAITVNAARVLVQAFLNLNL